MASGQILSGVLVLIQNLLRIAVTPLMPPSIWSSFPGLSKTARKPLPKYCRAPLLKIQTVTTSSHTPALTALEPHGQLIHNNNPTPGTKLLWNFPCH